MILTINYESGDGKNMVRVFDGETICGVEMGQDHKDGWYVLIDQRNANSTLLDHLTQESAKHIFEAVEKIVRDRASWYMGEL